MTSSPASLRQQQQKRRHPRTSSVSTGEYFWINWWKSKFKLVFYEIGWNHIFCMKLLVSCGAPCCAVNVERAVVCVEEDLVWSPGSFSSFRSVLSFRESNVSFGIVWCLQSDLMIYCFYFYPEEQKQISGQFSHGQLEEWGLIPVVMWCSLFAVKVFQCNRVAGRSVVFTRLLFLFVRCCRCEIASDPTVW